MSSPCVLLSRQIVCLCGQCAPEYFPIASAHHICGQQEMDICGQEETLTRLSSIRTILRSHPLTSSLHCTSQYSPSRSIDIQVLLLTSVSGCICYTSYDKQHLQSISDKPYSLGLKCQVKSSHLYLYSAFNNTNCNKALHSIKIGKLCQ